MKNTKSLDKKRRSFLKLSGLLGVGVAASALLPAEKSEAFLFNKKEYKVTKTRLAMGTYVSITAIHPSRDEAEQVIGEAFDEIDRLNLVLSRFDKNSPVTELNTTGTIEHMESEISEPVARALYYYQHTGGAFDITVAPLVDLYKQSFAAGKQPSEAQIKAVLSNIGSSNLRISGKSLSLGRPEMSITLDGIAKGYIVDQASELLHRKGVNNHLINAGGDIRTSGAAAQGRSWKVAVQDPAKKKEYPDIIEMKDGAVATSGNYEVFYDNEKLFHHIVNAKTGLSPHVSASVTVMASTVMDADALSTSVFVMEPEAGIRFIDSQMDCECLVITNAGEMKASKGWVI